MEPGKTKLIFDIKNSGKSVLEKKLTPIIEEETPILENSTEEQSFDEKWDTFREQERIYNMANSNFSSIRENQTPLSPKSPITEKSFATLMRLEDEDVTDKNNSIKYYGTEYIEVVDPELKTFFKETFGTIDKLSFTSKKYVYIGREDRW